MSSEQLVDRLALFVLLIPAIVFHEVAHGYAAFLLGDPTAKLRGRLSLNPLRHIDAFGTIILPLLMVMAFGFGFGYAKPVPIDPRRFRDYRLGMMLTGLAGPLANLTLAAASGLGVRLLVALPVGGTVAEYLFLVLLLFALVNLVLMFFNLIPLPPLDGSRVLPLFLPDRALVAYHRMERYGFVILFAALWLLPDLIGFDPLGAYLRATAYPLLRLFAGVSPP